MAIILGQKNVQDLPENQNVGIGILLPISNSSNGYFAQSFNTIDSVKTNIKNLLMTKQGERVMQPNFGTRLWFILFQNDSQDGLIEQDIQTTIEDAIQTWMPFLSIEEIAINKDLPTNRDINRFNVSITFQMSGIQDLQTVSFKIEE